MDVNSFSSGAAVNSPLHGLWPAPFEGAGAAWIVGRDCAPMGSGIGAGGALAGIQIRIGV
jgi:hypothetical protein